MGAAQLHYERLLAQHYAWMFGKPFAQIVAEQAALLAEAGVRTPGRCVDLGSGCGFQTVALTQLGATHVHAIDTSEALLRDLQSLAGNSTITTHQADLGVFDTIVQGRADTIVCMGDTITHLRHRDEVAGVFCKIAAKLQEGGRCVISWRDLSHPPQGVDRFIPVRADDDRIMVCCVEDFGETILVNDLVHVRGDNGWTLQKSSYPKLKLGLEWVRATLTAAGLTIDFEQKDRGLLVLAATQTRAIK